MIQRANLAKTSRPQLQGVQKESKLAKTLRPLREERSTKSKSNLAEGDPASEKEIKEMPNLHQLKGCKYIHSPLLSGNDNIKLNEDIDAYMDYTLTDPKIISQDHGKKSSKSRKSNESRGRNNLYHNKPHSHNVNEEENQKSVTTKASYLLANNRQVIQASASKKAPLGKNVASKQVESKVKQNMKSRERSTTPTREAPPVKASGKKKKVSRDKEIMTLQNNLQLLKQDLDFKKQNKSQILECYRSGSSARSNCSDGGNPYTDGKKKSQGKSSKNKDETNDSTGRSANVAKKGFGEIDLYLERSESSYNQNHTDWIYLDICGLTQALHSIIERASERSMDFSDTFHERKKDFELLTEPGEIKSEKHDYEDLEIISHEVQIEEEKAFVDNYVVSNARSHQFPAQSTQSNVDLEMLCKMVGEETQGESGGSFLHDESFLQRRDEIRHENQRLVEDFQLLYEQVAKQRQSSASKAFYEAIQEYDFEKKQLDEAVFRDADGLERVATSPTKRLICMKNSNIEHMKEIKDRNLLQGQAFVYMASPQRSYVVKPRDAIDYKLAYKKNPSKFIDDTLSKQPVLKYKIQRDRDSYSPPRDRDSMAGSVLGVDQAKTGKKKRRKKDFEVFTIESKKAPRPHQKIGMKIKEKIESKLKSTLGKDAAQNIVSALEQANAIEDFMEYEREELGSLEGTRKTGGAESCWSLPLYQQRSVSSLSGRREVEEAVSERYMRKESLMEKQ